MQLREYQEDDLAKLSKVCRSIPKNKPKRSLLYQSVGAGKSVEALYLATKYSEIGKKVLILCNRVAVIKDLNEKTSHLPGVFCMTVQTADSKKNREILPKEDFDLIIIDEAHMGGTGAQYKRVMEYAPNALVIAMTATPTPQLIKDFPNIAFGVTPKWLYEHGFLSKLRYFSIDPQYFIDRAKLKTRSKNGFKEFEDKQLIDELHKKQIYSNAVDEYKKHAQGKPTLAFCINVEHAKQVQKEFQERGVECEILVGVDKRQEEKIDFLKKGGLLITVDKVSAGFNLPDLYAILVMRPTNSLFWWIQVLGRPARLSKIYKVKKVIDLVGNTINHGFLYDDIDFTDLEKRENTQKTESGKSLTARQCTECFAFVESHHKECPYCNTPFAKETRIPKAESIKLRELEAEEIEKDREIIKEAKKRMGMTIKQRTLFLNKTKRLKFTDARDKVISDKRKKYEETFKYDDPILRGLIEEDFRKNNIQL